MPDIGAIIGASRWGGLGAQAEVTDLSAHVEGGDESDSGAIGATMVGGPSVMWLSVGYVLTALALLWAFGFFVFRGTRQ